MRKKMRYIPIAIVFLMLLIPVTAIGQTIQTSIEEKNQSEEDNNSLTVTPKTMEKNTEDTEKESTNSGISISGFLRIRVKIQTNDVIKKGHSCVILLNFDEGDTLRLESSIKRNSQTVNSGFIFIYRMNGFINSRDGTVKVTVKIREYEGGGWHSIVMEEDFYGTFNGPFISFN
jgi:hypothetical protein